MNAIRRLLTIPRRFGLAVLCAALILPGCVRGPRASMGHLLETSPDRKLASSNTDEQPVSSVTANAPGLAGEADGAVETIAAKPDASSDSLLVSEIEEGPTLPELPPSDGQDPVFEPLPEPEKPPGGPKIWDRRMVTAAAESTVNRLKKALSTDVRRESSELEPIARTHPLRVRIDGLQQKAVELLAAGDLQEAKSHAERAVDLSASLALEFLPNEEQPDEVLERIVAAIDALDQAPSANPALGSLEETSFVPADLSLPVLTPPPVAPALESLNSRSLNPGTVAANRPLRLAAQTESEPSSETTATLVEMGLPVEDEPREPITREGADNTGPTRPTSLDRLRLRSDAGPLLVSAERTPSTAQVAEVAPLPAFPSTVAARPAPPEPETPGTGFEWSDLWPVGVLGVLMLCFASGLLVRRFVTGH